MQTSHRTPGILSQLPVLVLALGLLAGAVACGGSQNPPAGDPGGDKAAPPPTKQEEDKAEALKRLRARQAEVCEDLCVRLNDCVRKDAEENDPDALATKDGITGEQLLKKHKENCLDQCNNSGIMTPDQRKGLVEQCFPMDDCNQFADCATKVLQK